MNKYMIAVSFLALFSFMTAIIYLGKYSCNICFYNFYIILLVSQKKMAHVC